MRSCFIIPRLKTLLAVLVLLTTLPVRAQTTATSSPYSRFALGRPENTGFSEIMALGGSYTAFRNDTAFNSTFFINQGNPSSYAFTKNTIYSFGARYGFYDFQSSDASVKKQNGGFNYISLSFPIRKKMGAAFGLIPFSNVGYEVTTNTEHVDSIGDIKNNYRGSGGINQAYLGFGYRPFEARPRNLVYSKWYQYKDSVARGLIASESSPEQREKARAQMRVKRFFGNMWSSFSVGGNASFMFGTINYATRKYFPASFGAVYNTCDYTETQLHDIYLQGGAQISFDINSTRRKELLRIDTVCYSKETHREIAQKPCRDGSGKTYYKLRKVYSQDKKWLDLEKKWRITLGYSVSLPKSVAATANHVAYTFTQASFNREIPFDTFSYQPNYKGTVNIPFMQSLGLGIRRGNSLMFVVDAGYQQWSKFSFLGNNQDLKDQFRFSGGMQFQPDREASGYGKYFKKTFYRVGGRYSTGYLFLKGNHISEYAVSGGIGLPMGRATRDKIFAVLNLSAEYGVAGTTNNKLIQERFLRFIVGLTINDRWFIKPKYD